MRFFILALLAVLFLSVAAAGQQPLNEPGRSVRDINERLRQMSASPTRSSERVDYQIGPEDLIDISVFEVPELSRTVRVSAAGDISLPLVGAIRAAGLSPLELEQSLTAQLKKTYLKDPQVTVFLKEYKADPVSVVGAVKMPGLYHIQTKKTLVEILAMAQGLSDGPMRHPGRLIVISRKARATAVGATATGATAAGATAAAGTEAAGSVAAGAATTGAAAPEGAAMSGEIIEVPIKELFHTGDPRLNVPIYPGDVVKVAQAGTVFVAGAVTRPGGFPLTDFDNVSAIQALAMAGGTTKAASQQKALIIRTDGRGNRTEEKVNLGRVLKGHDADITLGANDILFVPGSVGKESALRAIEMGIQTATGMLIWRR